MVRDRKGPPGQFHSLEQYVNDRPYVASSFLSVALSRVFGTAMGGRSKERPELAARELPLEARIFVLPCHQGEGLVRGLFEPLGYTVGVGRHALDDGSPSRYLTVALSGVKRLGELLTHLYVLVPALDGDKHYWIGDDEVEKLVQRGGDWLAAHPMRTLIVKRYLKRRSDLAERALEQSEEPEESLGEPPGELPGEKRIGLNQQRISVVVATLKSSGAKSVLDLGCGSGQLLHALVQDEQFEKITGVDVSYRTLARARRKLKGTRAEVISGSLVYQDDRLKGYDAATVVEVIEHFTPPQLAAFEHAVFGHARPDVVVITTPNIEYNVKFEGLADGGLRHRDHKFEWTRGEFRAWAEHVAYVFGYAVCLYPVGDGDPFVGSPTQMAVFRRVVQSGPPCDDLPGLARVLINRDVETRLVGRVTYSKAVALAALESMSRFTVDPRWLIYLPPTMSPCSTAPSGELLEHPDQAFDYYRDAGVRHVVCEEKHMGSRATIIVCRDVDAALKRFGVAEAGVCYTRMGRRFFTDPEMETKLLDEVRRAANHAGLWESLETDWLCLDCEVMPWSVKAEGLIQRQYASVAMAARVSLRETVSVLGRVAGAGALLERARERGLLAKRFAEAYQRYCWPVHTVRDLHVAPFHLLASEGRVHADRDHRWHLEVLEQLDDGGVLARTQHLHVDLDDEASVTTGVQWWEELTQRGVEGMVVKPLNFVVHGPKWLVQPAMKVRGPEYLRIIYGMDYTLPEHLERLRSRGLGRKRALAAREFALGIEGLERFVRREPLDRVHECAFGVLALESEPVDPRL
jgi:3' terminal RNA ribose 2'-O-methyltransferase Hen1